MVEQRTVVAGGLTFTIWAFWAEGFRQKQLDGLYIKKVTVLEPEKPACETE